MFNILGSIAGCLFLRVNLQISQEIVINIPIWKVNSYFFFNIKRNTFSSSNFNFLSESRRNNILHFCRYPVDYLRLFKKINEFNKKSVFVSNVYSSIPIANISIVTYSSSSLSSLPLFLPLLSPFSVQPPLFSLCLPQFPVIQIGINNFGYLQIFADKPWFQGWQIAPFFLKSYQIPIPSNPISVWFLTFHRDRRGQWRLSGIRYVVGLWTDIHPVEGKMIKLQWTSSSFPIPYLPM